MIIKGGARGAPKALAAHLQRADTNERVAVLELQSGLGDLSAALRDWQTLSEGTRGSKGLYHANIDPDARYTMTPAQWARAVDVLEKELGLEGQPRAVVLHEKHGREHIHVVWARTDIETMTLRTDSNNYLAHERASQALEQEFGHEAVPGKHAKRDREKQPEFPKAEVTHDEWQQAERSGLSAAERKEQVSALFRASDNGAAFKAALEEAGYILSPGDRRDFVLVDQAGDVHSLGRQLKGVKAAELREFMAAIDAASLPAIEAAKAMQAERQRPSVPEAAQTPEQVPVDPSPEVAAPTDAEIIQQALADRQAHERQQTAERQAREVEQTAAALEREVQEKLEAIAAMQKAARDRLAREHREQTTGLRGMAEALLKWFDPKAAAQKEEDRRREMETLRAGQAAVHAERHGELSAEVRRDLDDLKDRHDQQLREQEARFAEERDRYARDQQAAARLLAEVERQRLEAERRQQDGPEPPLIRK